MTIQTDNPDCPVDTNWMDQTLLTITSALCSTRFVSAAHRGNTRTMIWIGPPDSSRFSKVQNRIYQLIQQSVWRGDPMIDSRRFTRYLMAKLAATGSITIANRARHVIASIDEVLAANIAARRKMVSNC